MELKNDCQREGCQVNTLQIKPSHCRIYCKPLYWMSTCLQVLLCKYWNPIKNPQKYDGETVIVGSVTDGYNQCEEEFCRTRQLLEELEGSGVNLIITTKSDLVCRDLDLITQGRNKDNLLHFTDFSCNHQSH